MKRHLEELPAPPEWKQRVRDALAQKNVTQPELARRVGCAKSAISQLLSDRLNQRTSKLVEPISRELELELPIEAEAVLCYMRASYDGIDMSWTKPFIDTVKADVEASRSERVADENRKRAEGLRQALIRKNDKPK